MMQLTDRELIILLIGAIIGFISGGLATWDLIKRYRKSLGYKPDPFEPENIYMM